MSKSTRTPTNVNRKNRTSGFWRDRPVQPELPSFLTASEKEWFAELGDQAPFEVVDVREGSGEYGPCWWVIMAIDPDDVETEDGEVEIRTVTFGGRGTNEIRDSLMEDLRNYLGPTRPVRPGDGVPSKLVSFKTRSGNFAFSLSPLDEAVVDVEQPDAELERALTAPPKRAPRG